MTDHDLMIYIMNSLPKQYDPIVYNLEIRLMKKDYDPDKLMLDDLQKIEWQVCMLHWQVGA